MSPNSVAYFQGTQRTEENVNLQDKNAILKFQTVNFCFERDNRQENERDGGENWD